MCETFQESAFLLASIAVLLLGMVFTSRGFPVGSFGYAVINALTLTTIVVSVITFAVLLTFEVYRSVKVRAECPVSLCELQDSVIAALCNCFESSSPYDV
jgi:hypothetical protein